MIIDTHTHPFLHKIHKKETILETLWTSGITHIISVGINEETSNASIHLAKQYPQTVFASVGIHPHDALTFSFSSKALSSLKEMIASNTPYVKAIGECGFDFYKIESDTKHYVFEKQLQLFEYHLALAQEFSLPVIVHSRCAKEETYRVLKQYRNLTYILHCYSETDEEYMQKIIRHIPSCYFSFSGMVTYKHSQALRNIVASVPQEKILAETDCPFLAPEPYRWRECIPSYIIHTLQVMYECKKHDSPTLSFETFLLQVFMNSKKAFWI